MVTNTLIPRNLLCHICFTASYNGLILRPQSKIRTPEPHVSLMPPKPVPWRGYDHVPLPAHDGDSHLEPQTGLLQDIPDTFLGSWFWKPGNFLILGFLPLNEKFELSTRQRLQEVDHACGGTFPLSQCSSRKCYLFSGDRSWHRFLSTWLILLPLTIPLPGKAVCNLPIQLHSGSRDKCNMRVWPKPHTGASRQFLTDVLVPFVTPTFTKGKIVWLKPVVCYCD